MRTFLALLTVNSVNFFFWGSVGCLRYLHQKTSGQDGKASAQVIALALPALISAVLLAVSTGPLVWLVLLICEPLRLDSASAAGFAAVVVHAWLAACGAMGSYVGARTFNMSYSAFAIAVCGSLYWIGVIGLAPDALDTGLALYRPDVGPLVLLGVSLLSGWPGLLLARRRARALEAAKALLEAGESSGISIHEVAVLVAAHNEARTICLCLDAAAKIIPRDQIFVGSDGSTDDTVSIARERGIEVLDIHPNGGKARALRALIDHYAICERYKAVLILDADSEIDEHYLERALPLFDDPGVAAIAGHALSKWHHHWRPKWSMFFIAYRVRLYKIIQTFMRYGQTWKHSNVSFIVPGFASMYRSSVVTQMKIDAPGLIIEDFNMTFELHKKKLGRIAYMPSVRCTSQDVHNMWDYFKQVRRWYLGFWQTIRLHGVWVSVFWLSLGAMLAEMLLQSVVFLWLPALLVWFIVAPGDPVAVWLPPLGWLQIIWSDVVIGMIAVDYLWTIFVAVQEKKPILLIYGFGFVLLRWMDALLFLYTLPLAYIVKSDGRWVSPKRM